MSKERAWEVFVSVLPFLRVFNPYARCLANYRDHALLVYDRRGTRLRPEVRQFPRVAYAQMPPTPWSREMAEQRSLTC
jgi:hypothetical protein